MPSPDFLLKTGDTGSAIQSVLENSGGTAIDISGASVLFKLGPLSGGTLTIAGTAIIDQVGAGTVDGTRGLVHYNWPTGGITTADWYRGEFEVTFLSGTIQSFPNDGYFTVAVRDDL